MANIQTIQPLEIWFEDERPSYNKFNSNIRDTIDTMVANDDLINTGLSELLRGVGAEQAVMPMVMSSAPTGWTREPSFTDGTVLRVTDGSTVPPGASPTATGGVVGGSWTISGINSSVDGAHTHTMEAHTHSLSGHTHSSSGHAHTMGNHGHSYSSTHSHTVAASADTATENYRSNFSVPSSGADVRSSSAIGPTNISVQMIFRSASSPFNYGYTQFGASHVHTLPSHTHSASDGSTGSTGTTSTNNTGSGTPGVGAPTSDVTSLATADTTSSDGGHSHTASHDGSWVPKHVTVIICSKD